MRAAAGAAVVAAAGLGAAERAEAANGDAILIGSTSNTGTALTKLTSTGGRAFEGVGANGWEGVVGTCNGVAGFGLYGVSDSGYGLWASSETGIGVNVAGSGRIAQQLRGTAGAPTTGTFNAGEQIRDSLGELYICTLGGTPGTWKHVVAVRDGLPANGDPIFVGSAANSGTAETVLTSTSSAAFEGQGGIDFEGVPGICNGDAGRGSRSIATAQSFARSDTNSR